MEIYAKAARLFIAATLALAAAQMLGFHNPYWAAMPVWVVSQPIREDLLARGILRILGTLAGAGIGLLGLQYLNAPVPLSLLAGATVAFGVGMAYRIGTTYSYGFTLIAITIGVILLPAIGMGADGVSMAIERLWCTLLGVVSVTLVTLASTPARSGPMPPRAVPFERQQLIRRVLISGGCAALGTLAVALTHEVVVMAGAMALIIYATIFSTLPEPRAVIRMVAPGVALGLAAAVLYRWIGFELHESRDAMLWLAMAFIACGALLRAHPRTTALGLDSNMCFLLGAEVGTAGHPLHVTIFSGAALLAGAIVISVIMWYATAPAAPQGPAPTA